MKREVTVNTTLEDENNKKRGKTVRELFDVYSLYQLLSSYLVAKAIVEIRREKQKALEEEAQKLMPIPNIPEDSLFMELYKKFASLVNYNVNMCCIAQIAIEDIYKYDFKNTESITTVQGETEHLNEMVGKNFKKLKKISLFEHTLDVFEEAMKKGEVQRRTLQIGIPILASLIHDFGKAKEIRIKLLGSVAGARGAGYRPHAEVSGLYVEELLVHELYKRYKLSPVETLETLEMVVKNHHTTSKKLSQDKVIQFVKECDILARKKELRKIAMEEQEEE